MVGFMIIGTGTLSIALFAEIIVLAFLAVIPFSSDMPALAEIALVVEMDLFPRGRI